MLSLTFNLYFFSIYWFIFAQRENICIQIQITVCKNVLVMDLLFKPLIRILNDLYL